MPLKRPDYLIDQKDVDSICFIGDKGVEMIRGTNFSSQNDYNHRRGIRVANILNDYFEIKNFKGKRLLELGPGHYAFSLLARHLGAEVVCIERDPHFIELGRYLGFEVHDIDFRDLSPELIGETFDGLWLKGTFNSCAFASDESVVAFSNCLTSLTKPEGWSWMIVANNDDQAGRISDEEFVNHRIEVQCGSLVNDGWLVLPIIDEIRPLYSLKYRGCPNIYTRNLPAYAEEIEGKILDNNNLPPVSRDRAFNRVQRVWKPTVEYFDNPWQYYVDFINIVKQRGGKFITMSQALSNDYDQDTINVLLDHHIDFYPIETEVMCRWELENNVVSNIYLFNRFDYDDTSQRKIWHVEDLNIDFYQKLEKNGFEIGYHQNALGLIRNKRMGRLFSLEVSEEDKLAAHKVFAEDIDNLRNYFNISTFIPHGAGEGNAQLVELPAGYEDVIWVYNNAKRNGTCPPPLKWRNFSDTAFMAQQLIKGHDGQYVVHVDNLHLNAYLLQPGLNHVLVHPGRFAKGMPYELFDSSVAPSSGMVVTQEFDPFNCDLPLQTKEIIKEWENPKTSLLKKTYDRFVRSIKGNVTPEAPYRKKHGPHKYYVVSDDISVLKNHLATSDHVIGIHVMHRRITPEEREACRSPRPVKTSFHLPLPEENFEVAFRKFYNSLYADNIFKHLEMSDVPLDVLCLKDVEIKSKDDFLFVARTLKRAPEDASIYLHIKCTGFSKKFISSNIEEAMKASQVDEKYQIRISSAPLCGVLKISTGI